MGSVVHNVGACVCIIAIYAISGLHESKKWIYSYFNKLSAFKTQEKVNKRFVCGFTQFGKVEGKVLKLGGTQNVRNAFKGSTDL